MIFKNSIKKISSFFVFFHKWKSLLFPIFVNIRILFFFLAVIVTNFHFGVKLASLLVWFCLCPVWRSAFSSLPLSAHCDLAQLALCFTDIRVSPHCRRFSCPQKTILLHQTAGHSGSTTGTDLFVSPSAGSWELHRFWYFRSCPVTSGTS